MESNLIVKDSGPLNIFDWQVNPDLLGHGCSLLKYIFNNSTILYFWQ
jgi:hypothetical protein